MGLEQSMVNKFEEMLSVSLLLQTKTLYQFRMYTKLVVWHLSMDYKLLTEHYNTWIKRKMGTVYPFC